MVFNILGNELHNKRKVLNTDNQALVADLNKKNAKVKESYEIGKAISSKHLENVIADALSRQQWSRFHQLYHEQDLLPTPVPLSFHSLILNVEKD
ncbi:hypothetical protein KUTeg_024444 [Tegillarca granosa]|uniref:Uncharacterized protein n=1 Tax=Tegillarca granosa TaxID=220873 RepID=A0ABQ9E3N7_TEGGR|nr:hypothetical protein KUTeg_024444 [Tegillarca granosa]